MKKPLFRGTKRWVIIVSAMLLASLLLAACGGNPPSTLVPHGPIAQEEAILFWIIFWIALIIFVVVEGLLIFAIVRYRERPNSPLPAQVHGNNRLELIWTVIPTVVLFIVLGVTISTLVQVNNLGKPNLEVKVIAHQWWWEFDYPAYHIVTADSMHIQAGEIVQADLISNNVIHSFWVPALTGKKDVIPGHNNQMLFEADMSAAGNSYPGECAEFCGAQHAHMHFDVVVDSPNNFMTWVISQQQVAQVAANGTLAAQGAKLFAQGACVGCHGIVGVNLTSTDDPKAAGLIGPNLTHFGSRSLIAGGVLPNDPTDLGKWLANPQDVKPGVDMPDLGLSNDQINALVAYLESLK